MLTYIVRSVAIQVTEKKLGDILSTLGIACTFLSAGLFIVCLFWIENQLMQGRNEEMQRSVEYFPPSLDYRVDINFLTAFDPFFPNGRLVEMPNNVGVNEAHIELNKKFTLRGTRVSSRRGGAAIIENQDGSQSLVNVGDYVSQNVRLESVTQHGAVLEELGRKVRLHFPVKGTNDQQGYNSIGIVANRIAPHQFRSSTDIINALRLVNFSPTKNPEFGVGLRVTGAKDFDNLEKLGLRQDDILYKADGGELAGVEDLISLAVDFTIKSGVTLTVVRSSSMERFYLALG